MLIGDKPYDGYAEEYDAGNYGAHVRQRNSHEVTEGRGNAFLIQVLECVA